MLHTHYVVHNFCTLSYHPPLFNSLMYYFFLLIVYQSTLNTDVLTCLKRVRRQESSGSGESACLPLWIWTGSYLHTIMLQQRFRFQGSNLHKLSCKLGQFDGTKRTILIQNAHFTKWKGVNLINRLYKRQFSLFTSWRYIVGVQVNFRSFLSSALEGGEWSHPHFTFRERISGNY